LRVVADQIVWEIPERGQWGGTHILLDKLAEVQGRGKPRDHLPDLGKQILTAWSP